MSEGLHIMVTDDGGGRRNHMPVDYPSNARTLRAAKEPEEPPKQEKKVEKIVEGVVVTRKRPLWRRAGDAMAGEDTGEGVLYYVLMDVFVPATKSLIYDVFSQGLERYLFGVARPRSRADRPAGHINYTAKSRPSAYNQVTAAARARHDFNDVILESRGEAEDVLDGLLELVEQFGSASVEDFYDLVGISTSFTDNKWGWNDLHSASVRATRGGYMIILPRTIPLDR